MRLVAVVLGLLLSFSALADTKTVTWTNPTTNTDGSTIPATGAGSLVRTTVEYGLCNATNTGIATKQGEIFVAAPAQTLQLPLPVIQMYCLDAYTSNTFAATFAPCTIATCPQGNSAISNVVVTQSNPPQPSPPSTLMVNASNLTAYQPVFSDGDVHFVAVGTLAPNTPCISGVPVKDHFAVARANVVSWFGNVKPQFVVAVCS